MRPMFIQIPRWLRHPEVWRFLGFASTIIELLCYALSSSFNYLFGKWNLAKHFVYFVLSIIICLATLFAKGWQHSPSLRFRAHVAFLVLTITSVYSFFFDKAVNGKPDAYSLVSCVAFAMMCLSLSRQIHCGFEVDLLYFFLGALIVQLMKINKLLGMLGVCFSYFIVVLRSSLEAPLENDNFGPRDRNHVVIQVDSEQSDTDNALIMAQAQSYETVSSLSETQVVVEDKDMDGYESYYKYEKDDDDGGDGNKYPDPTDSLFDSEDLDLGGSKIDLVKNSKEQAGQEFKMEDELNHRAELFIRKFNRQLLLQKQDSFKRWQEMLLSGGA